MRMLHHILLFIFLLNTLNDAGVTSAASPNIIFLLTDDMGYADISARGSEFETPHLDNLYEHSIVLNSHYIGLLCSPSRSQILTGRYAWNMGLSNFSPFGPTKIMAIPGAFPTIADILGEYTDYKSYAVGKWHVGYSTENHIALSRGFDQFHGFYTTGIFYQNKTREWTKSRNPKYYIDWRKNEEIDYDTQFEYSTYVTRDRILTIIDNHANNNKPFYIYAAFQAPHDPLAYVESNNMANCDGIDDSDRYVYCLNILALDSSVGSIVSQLKLNDMWDNTLIVVTSDNGGAVDKGGCNYPLRGTKGTFYEGGIRSIAFIGGGYVPQSQRGTQRNEMMHGSDWLPTIIGLATTSSSGVVHGHDQHKELSNVVNIETISNDLQERLYIPIAKRVALKKENTTENYLKYLVGESFDGIDLSQWLLYGNNSENSRTNVGLSINNLSPLNVSVSIVFESEITNHRYKFMYLTSWNVDDGEYCTFCSDDDNSININSESESRQRCIIRDVEKSNKLMFDLTIDANESTNIMTDSIDIMLMSNTSEFQRLTNSNYNDKSKFHYKSNCNYEINDLSDYKKSVNQELVQLLWDEAEIIIYEYQQNILYNTFLFCQRESFDESNPANFDDAFSPFFSWQEYQVSFEQVCGDHINDVLLEMYLSYYGDY